MNILWARKCVFSKSSSQHELDKNLLKFFFAKINFRFAFFPQISQMNLQSFSIKITKKFYDSCEEKKIGYIYLIFVIFTICRQKFEFTFVLVVRSTEPWRTQKIRFKFLPSQMTFLSNFLFKFDLSGRLNCDSSVRIGCRFFEGIRLQLCTKWVNLCMETLNKCLTVLCWWENSTN